MRTSIDKPGRLDRFFENKVIKHDNNPGAIVSAELKFTSKRGGIPVFFTPSLILGRSRGLLADFNLKSVITIGPNPDLFKIGSRAVVCYIFPIPFGIR